MPKPRMSRPDYEGLRSLVINNHNIRSTTIGLSKRSQATSTGLTPRQTAGFYRLTSVNTLSSGGVLIPRFDVLTCKRVEIAVQ